MVLAKAIGLSWEITRAILQMRGPAKTMSAADMEANALKLRQAATEDSGVRDALLPAAGARAEAQLEAV